jgi:hypothetical protein
MLPYPASRSGFRRRLSTSEAALAIKIADMPHSEVGRGWRTLPPARAERLREPSRDPERYSGAPNPSVGYWYSERCAAALA